MSQQVIKGCDRTQLLHNFCGGAGELSLSSQSSYLAPRAQIRWCSRLKGGELAHSSPSFFEGELVSPYELAELLFGSKSTNEMVQLVKKPKFHFGTQNFLLVRKSLNISLEQGSPQKWSFLTTFSTKFAILSNIFVQFSIFIPFRL